MKTCVFITGTNGVGKSALAWRFIERYGGVDRLTKDLTYLADGKTCLAGRYTDGKRYGGVDRLTNDKGSSCTSRLPEAVEEGLKTHDTIFCEGSFMNTFGLNLTNAMFKAQKHLLVCLYVDKETLYKRITERSNGRWKDGVRSWGRIATKQLQAIKAAQKWQSIGVKVLFINTAETTIEEEVELVEQTIAQL